MLSKIPSLIVRRVSVMFFGCCWRVPFGFLNKNALGISLRKSKNNSVKQISAKL